MGQLIHLGLYCICILFITVSQSHNCNTCTKIQVFISFCIPQGYAFSMVKYYRKPVICFIQDMFCPIDHFLISHDNTSHLPLNYK